MSRVLITTLRNAFLHKPLQIWAAGVFCKASVSMQIAGLQSDVFGGRNAGEAGKEINNGVSLLPTSKST